jgi:hypothetical protein
MDPLPALNLPPMLVLPLLENAYEARAQLVVRAEGESTRTRLLLPLAVEPEVA